MTTYWKGEPEEESRQHYATVRIQEYQREFPRAAFQTLLHAFRYYGMVYDQGYRTKRSRSESSGVDHEDGELMFALSTASSRAPATSATESS